MPRRSPFAPASLSRFIRATVGWVVAAGLLGMLIPGRSWAQRSQILDVVTISDTDEPFAPSPTDKQGKPIPGQGLCAAFRPTTQPMLVFPARDPLDPKSSFKQFVDRANLFMDLGGPGGGAVRYATLQSYFDLSSGVNLTNNQSVGDYRNTPGCPKDYNTGTELISSGCPFPGAYGDLQSGFGTRFRGFFNVPLEWMKFTVHFGFYTDDAVAVTVWSRLPARPGMPSLVEPVSYLLLARPAETGSTNFRVTNGIRFPKPGLYAIEILHAQYNQTAALEFGVLGLSDFQDLDVVPSMSSQPLSALGFSLQPTRPQSFFQTHTGVLSDATPESCQQCPRSAVNQHEDPNSPSRVCKKGMYCNEAAVCAPCIGDRFCGSSCKECAAPEPYCVRDPRSSDPSADFTCVECRADGDCKQGLLCVRGTCKSPCSCCPDAPHCVETDVKNHPGVSNCSECRNDGDCGAGRACDLLNGRCVDALPECREDGRCGPDCVSCPEISKDDPKGARPFCLYGKVCVQCRFDYDCKAGSYCRSGDCVPCTHDRHCGPGCSSCGRSYELAADGETVVSVRTDKPYCLVPSGQLDSATCVRCLTDAQCGTGGRCNPSTHECENTCQVSCPAGQLCDGGRCVECLTSSQCPCGQCQDGACTATCADTTDCSGTMCCQQSTGQCVREKCGPGSAAGGALCCGVGGAGIAGLAGRDDAAAGGARASRGTQLLIGLWAVCVLLGGLRLRRRAARVA